MLMKDDDQNPADADDLMHDWEAQATVLEDDALYTQGVSYFKLGVTPCDFDFEAYAELVSNPPPINHWLACELDSLSAIEAFFGYCKKEDLAKQMLELGIAPDQHFMVEDTYWTNKSWTDYGWEFDAGIDWCIIRSDPWSPEKILDAWERVLTDMGLECHTLS